MSDQNAEMIARAVEAALAKQRRRNRWIAVGVGLVVVAALIVLLLPSIIAGTGLRNRVLAKAFPNWNGSIDCGAASLGWLSPVQFKNVVITSADGEEVVNVPLFETERTLWQFITGGDDLGELRLTDATIVIVVQEEGVNLSDLVKRTPKSAPEEIGSAAPAERKPKLSLKLVNATLSVRGETPDAPAATLAPLNVRASADYDAAGQRVWTIDKGRILENVPVTREVVDSGMKYVTPILANAAWVEGTFSLDVEECRIPVATPKLSKASGKISIHSVEAGAKNPLVVELVGFAGTLLNRDVPTKIRVADESGVDFKLEDERVYHGRLEFGLPEVSSELLVQTEGSVGLDQTLDLTSDIPLPLQRFGDHPILQRLGNQKIRLLIKGPLSEPQISVAGAMTKTGENTVQELLKQLSGSVKPGDEPTADEVVETLKSLGDQLIPAERRKPGEREPVEETIAKEALSIGSKLLDRTRQRIEERRAEREQPKDAPESKPADEVEPQTKKPRVKSLLRGLFKAIDETREDIERQR